MHGASNPTSGVGEATNERTIAMGTAVLNGVEDTAHVEESNVNVVDLDKLTATDWQFLQPADFDPTLGHYQEIYPQSLATSRGFSPR
jgi:hypothetical protein